MGAAHILFRVLIRTFAHAPIRTSIWASIRATILAGLVLLSPPASASEDDLTPGGWAMVERVVDGDTVILTQSLDGANEVRLVGIQAPKLPLGRAGFKKWPFADEAKVALETLVLGKRVQLHFGGQPMDRHGRHLAHLFLDDGVWVQGRMLEGGFARVYSFADNRARIGKMLDLEKTARGAGRGLWSDQFYAVRDGKNEGARLGELGTFQVIEGRVLDAAKVKGTVYLNFGQSWRSDFTVRIGTAAMKAFKASGVDPLKFQNRIVRVRGWLDQRNGPEIEATHPEQIEIVE